MPGICRYPAKCTGHAVNQGGTADSVVRLDHVLYSSLTDSIILSGAFFIPASNEPSGHACMRIWRLPRGSNTPLLCSATNLMPRCLQRGL